MYIMKTVEVNVKLSKYQRDKIQRSKLDKYAVVIRITPDQVNMEFGKNFDGDKLMLNNQQYNKLQKRVEENRGLDLTLSKKHLRNVQLGSGIGDIGKYRWGIVEPKTMMKQLQTIPESEE